MADHHELPPEMHEMPHFGTTGTPTIQYAAFLVIDWADQKHVWSLQEANSSTHECGEVDHMPAAIEAWVAQMSQRFAGPIAVAVEQTRGCPGLAAAFIMEELSGMSPKKQKVFIPIYPNTLPNVPNYPKRAERRL